MNPSALTREIDDASRTADNTCVELTAHFAHGRHDPGAPFESLHAEPDRLALVIAAAGTTTAAADQKPCCLPGIHFVATTFRAVSFKISAMGLAYSRCTDLDTARPTVCGIPPPLPLMCASEVLWKSNG